MFKEITNRDAWSTIRGFVYQVDITLMRWLDLTDNQALELEKGEDIDIINEGIDSERSRTLEQVKYRESTLSLNTELAIELLLNFFIHKNSNPNENLQFRFVTNAGYNVERPALFGKSKSGISVWQEIFNEENISDSDARLATIKDHLLAKINAKIGSLNGKDGKEQVALRQWSDFKIFLERPKSLLRFIKDFEWSMENNDADSISEDVKLKVANSPHLGHVDPDKVYQRLFMFVFKLLAHKSLKRLDVSILKSESLLPELNSQDQTVFNVVSELLNSLQDRVSSIEGNMATAIEDIRALTEEVSQVKSSDAVFEIRLKNLSYMPPPALRNGSVRESKKKILLESLKKTPWINLQGINGTGKTQLALLTSRSAENVYWIDLREYNDSPEKSSLYITSILAKISGIPQIAERQDWIFSVLEKFPKNTMLVLNDIPEIENYSSLKEILTNLSINLKGRKVYLLTTSNYKIPRSLLATLPPGHFQEFYDFTFDDDEVREILVKNGAPDGILKFADLFASVSHRNPQIISTIVSRLVEMNWGEDSGEVFEKLFTREFSHDIFKNSQSSITKLIKDAQTKELLYRLSLVHWGYQINIVQAVCQAETKIDSPFEKLQGITNTWIEESGEFYKTSPLIHDLGVLNLSPETLKTTYRAIANAILNLRSIDLINASRIIYSFIKAENYNEAGVILLSLLRSATNEQALKSLQEWGYLNYWSATDMPRKMSDSIKSHIITEQIRICKNLDMDPTALQNRLKDTVEGMQDLGEKTLALMIIVASDTVVELEDYMRYAKFIIEHTQDLSPEFEKIITPQLLEGFLWIPLQKISTDQEVVFWLQLSELYESKTGTSFYADKIAETGIAVLSDRIVKFEKQSENFEPVRLAERLDRLYNYFYEKGHNTLAATVLKERISLEFIVLDEPEKSENMTLKWIENLKEPAAKYLLTENLGKLYYNKSKNPKGNAWLERAILYDCEDQTTFADTLAYGAAAKSDSENSTAVKYMERAVNITSNTPYATELDIVQMISELGISYWKNGEFQKSYNTFSDALTRLQAVKLDHFGPYWIRIASWMAHSLGYISADVAKDDLPLHFRDGAQYIKPYQGIFLFNTKDLSDVYSHSKEVLMIAQMAVFSEGVGNLEGAYKWSLRAFDEARKTGDESLVMMVSIACNHYLLINFKFEEHFEMAMQFHALSSHVSGTPEEKHYQASKLDYGLLLKSRPSSEWSLAEDTLFTMSVLPMLVMALNSLNISASENGKSLKLLQLIKNYSKNASNKKLWEEAHALVEKICSRTASTADLTGAANNFAMSDQRNLQIVALLGVIFLERQSISAMLQIITIFPFFTATFSYMPAITRNIFIPFVKFYAISCAKEGFVGTNEELAEIIGHIDAASLTKANPLQKMIGFAVDASEILIEGDRRDWIRKFKEI